MSPSRGFDDFRTLSRALVQDHGKSGMTSREVFGMIFIPLHNVWDLTCDKHVYDTEKGTSGTGTRGVCVELLAVKVECPAPYKCKTKVQGSEKFVRQLLRDFSIQIPPL